MYEVRSTGVRPLRRGGWHRFEGPLQTRFEGGQVVITAFSEEILLPPGTLRTSPPSSEHPLIERLRECLRAEDDGGSVDETDEAIAAIDAALCRQPGREARS